MRSHNIIGLLEFQFTDVEKGLYKHNKYVLNCATQLARLSGTISHPYAHARLRHRV